jgi:two-component system LytT family response regulator
MSEEVLKKINCIAVDDESMALTVIRSHVSKIPWLQLDAVFKSAGTALAYLAESPADLIFLDIQMPGMTGLEMAGFVNGNTRIIFTTAYPDYAVKGFEIAALDYLLKPIGFERFLSACERARNQLMSATPAIEKRSALYLKDGFNWIRIDPETVIYLEASDNYVIFYEANRKLTVRMTLSEALEKLRQHGFERIHKSYGVALSAIERIEGNKIVTKLAVIPLSEKYKTQVLEKLSR